MTRHEGDYVLIDCQCGKRLRFPHQNRALIVTCPECKRSFLWFPDATMRRLNFVTRLLRSLREHRWSSLTLIVVVVATFYLGYFIAHRSMSGRKDEKAQTPSPVSTPSMVSQSDVPLSPTLPKTLKTLSVEPLLPKRTLPEQELVKKQPVSLPNGTNISPPYGRRGLSILKVINGTPRDAAIKLVGTNGKLYRFVYVRRGESVEIKQVPAGTYYFRWYSGLDWDKQSCRFRQACAFFEAERLFVFPEKREGNRVQSTKVIVTLHEVPFGNLPERLISESEFNSHERGLFVT